MGAQRDRDLHTGAHVIAEHLDDAPDGLGALGGLIGDLGDHDLPLLRTHEPIARDDHVVAQALVVRHHEADTALRVESADHAAGAALQHLHHRTLEPPAPIAAGDTRDDAVTMEQPAHLFRVQIEIVTTVVGLDEAEAVGVADHPPGDQIALVDQAEGVATIAHQLAVANHRTEATLQRRQVIVGGQVKDLGNLGELHRRPMLGQGLQDELPARDGVVVFLGFALLVRI